MSHISFGRKCPIINHEGVFLSTSGLIGAPMSTSYDKLVQLFNENNAEGIVELLSENNELKTSALIQGPLDKTKETIRLEIFIKNFIGRDDDFQVLFDEQEKSYLVTDGSVTSGSVTNLTKLMAKANFNHLSFSAKDNDNFLSLLTRHGVFEEGGKSPSAVMAELEELFELKDSKNELNDLSFPEKMAIRIYTGDSYDPINHMLKGRHEKLYEDGITHQSALTYLMVSAFAISGLQHMSDQPIKHAYRVTGRSFPASLVARRKAAELGGVTRECGLISTSSVAPDDDDFGDPSNEGGSCILYMDLKGKNIKALSVHEDETEFLIPPTDVQWVHCKHSETEALFFVARPVTSLDLHSDLSSDLPKNVVVSTFRASPTSVALDTDKFDPFGNGNVTDSDNFAPFGNANVADIEEKTSDDPEYFLIQK